MTKLIAYSVKSKLKNTLNNCIFKRLLICAPFL